MDIRIARIFNTFGPRMHMNDGRVVSNFIIQAIQDKPITVGSTHLSYDCLTEWTYRSYLNNMPI